ncbi:hypothetical protein ACIP4X_03060 [Streptomyces sp. NPDC088817]|uniref:SCO2400 family protein n=1 Tax=unclassified Streptomyces TaxID=2593676 RepID=UPI0037FB2960
MNYCHPCRRHLNGALACPGCGTPVESPPVHTEDPGVSAEPAATQVPQESGEFHPDEGRAERAGDDDGGGDDGHAEPEGRAGRRRSRGRGVVAEDGAEEDVEGDVDDAEGRSASRRDRKAAVHRRRRRRVVLMAAGFVLAGGGLSLAELGVDAPGLPGFSSQEPAAVGDDVGEDDASPSDTGGTAGPTDGAPGSVTDTATPDASKSASPSASAKDGQPEPDASDTSGPRQSAEATVQSDTGRSADRPSVPDSATPEAPQPADPPASDPAPPPPQPDPTPTPTHTCDRFLWWCT